MIADADGRPRRVTLIATGSEVAIALAAREQLQAAGIATTLVSMLCCELFDERDASYRLSVLGVDCVRVAVKAAVWFGWDRYLGECGDFVGIEGLRRVGPRRDALRALRHHGGTCRRGSQASSLNP